MNRAFRVIPYLLLALTPSAALQASYASTPVGAVKLTVKGNGGSGVAVTYLSVPFHQGDSYVGTVTGAGASSLSCSTAAWTTNAYANAYYVEITSGANAGVAATITANTATSLTLAEDLSAFSPNSQTFAIRKYTTLADVFGATNSAGLQGGTSATPADEVLLHNPENQTFKTYYYKTGGLGGTGWRSTSSTSVNEANAAIVPGSSVIVKRKVNGDLTVYTSGTVQGSNAVTAVFPQTNFISSQYPLPVTLANFFGPTGGSLLGATTVTNADQVLIPTTGSGFDTYYYKTGGLGGIGWRRTDSNSTDRANVVIAQPGGVIILKRKALTAFNLTQTKPY